MHWARTPQEACAAVLQICRSVGAKIVTKGKSMVAEEIGLNDFLEANGITPVETDLGEYIIQLRHEPPSHIIAPAIHLVKEQVAETFRAEHRSLDPDRPLVEPRQMCDEARAVLRPRFLAADVGITGANFLVAETGSSIIVTNEGNGDLTQTLPRDPYRHDQPRKGRADVGGRGDVAAPAGALGDGSGILVTTRRSRPDRAGRAISTGPSNTTSCCSTTAAARCSAGEFQDMLRCIRCAACMNHCPVYAAVGGHAYGWVYPGPMGAVLTPSLIGIEEAGHLPNASTFCGRCESVCPVKIPLPKMMRHWREREYAKKLSPPVYRTGLSAWAWVARRPALYHRARRDRQPGARLGRPQAAAGSALCRWPPAGPRCATCRRRRAAAFTASGRSGRKAERRGERARANGSSAASGARWVAVRLDPETRTRHCEPGSRRIAATWSRRGRRRSTSGGGSSCSSRWPRRCRRR